MQESIHFSNTAHNFEVRRAAPRDAPQIKDVLHTTFRATYIGIAGRYHLNGFRLPFPQTINEAHIADTVYPDTRSTDALSSVLAKNYEQDSELLYLAIPTPDEYGLAGMGKFNLNAPKIEEMDVRPAYQHRGYGKGILYLGLAAITGRHGASTVVSLDVVEGNSLAHQWYERLGFKETQCEWTQIFRGGPMLRWIGMTAVAGEVIENLQQANPWLREAAGQA